MTAKAKIDEYISKTDDWRGSLLMEIRELIHEVDPDIEEEWKWNSPVFSHQGKMICSPGAFKSHLGLNFFQGAMIEDPDGLFNSGLEAKKSRSINFQKGDEIDKKGIKKLVKRAIVLNKNKEGNIGKM